MKLLLTEKFTEDNDFQQSQNLQKIMISLQMYVV